MGVSACTIMFKCSQKRRRLVFGEVALEVATMHADRTCPASLASIPLAARRAAHIVQPYLREIVDLFTRALACDIFFRWMCLTSQWWGIVRQSLRHPVYLCPLVPGDGQTATAASVVISVHMHPAPVRAERGPAAARVQSTVRSIMSRTNK